MLKYLEHIKRILSHPLTGMAILITAILSRILQLLFFYNIRVDASFQVMATQSFVNGQGFSIAKAYPSDLAQTIYEPLANWPPGYSILLSPFFLLFSPNYMWGGIVLDTLAALLLIFSLRNILKFFLLPPHLVNIYTFIIGCFVYYFYFIASSDAIAIALISFSVYYILKLCRAEKQNGKFLFFSSSALIIAGWIKYMFIPVVILIPLLVWVYGKHLGKKNIYKAGMLSFVTVLTGCAALLLFQQFNTGTAAYISQPERGFFPHHLSEFYPFIPAAFIKPDTAEMIISGNTDFSKNIYRFMQAVHLLALISITIILAKSIAKRSNHQISLKKFFFLTSYIICIAITSLLAFLSLTVAKEEILPGWFWTYIEEARYFGLCTVLVQTAVFLWMNSISQKKFKWFFSIIILLMFLPETARGIAFTANRIRNWGQEEYSWQYEHRFEKQAAHIIDSAIIEGEKPVITGSGYYMNHRISIYKNAPLLDSGLLINDLSSLKSSSPVLLLVILQDKDLQSYSQFISTNNNALAGKFEDYSFYTIHVEAGK